MPKYRATITAEGLAARWNRSIHWAYKATQHEGFPDPAPAGGRPIRYYVDEADDAIWRLIIGWVPHGDPDDLLTEAQAAQYAGWKWATWRRKRWAGELPDPIDDPDGDGLPRWTRGSINVLRANQKRFS